MVRIFSFFAILLFLSIVGPGCDKDDDPPPQVQPPPPPPRIDSGELIASVNGRLWKPTEHTATYYPKWQQLYIDAMDTAYKLQMVVNLDFSNLLKSYPLESNGGNVAELMSSSGTFHSDENVADAGGRFVLSKFDTVGRKVSGELQFVSYSGKRTRTIFTSSSIKDLPLSFETSEYIGNVAKCTVVGATTTEWFSKDVYGSLTCSSGTQKRLEIVILSPLLSRARELKISIPLLKPGVYPVYPDIAPYNTSCSNDYLRSVYKLNGESQFNTTTGTMTIISIDTVLRKLNASFDITYKHTVRQEIIQIKNGLVEVNGWGN